LIFTSLSKFLFLLARSRVGAIITGWSFAYLSDFIPVNKLHETEHVVAFYHPKPSYPLHILIVPKRRIQSLLALTDADTAVVQEVIKTAQYLAQTLALEEKGFRLIVNGGAYQDVMQIHWHLISDAF
jgi:histidine triad (HIT) family protein